MQKWEYWTLTHEMFKDTDCIKDSLPSAVKTLDELGKSGWDVVSVQSMTMMADFVLFVYVPKRPLRETAE